METDGTPALLCEEEAARLGLHADAVRFSAAFDVLAIGEGIEQVHKRRDAVHILWCITETPSTLSMPQH